MEREYTIPLRKEFQKAPRYKRASKSIRAIKEFIKKHMKTEKVVLGKYLNLEVWKNGPKNPPSKVIVKAIKEEDKVKVELLNAPEEPVKEEPKKEKKSAKEKLEEKIEEKTPEPKEAPEKTPETPKPKKKEEKVPTASELAKKKTTKPKKTPKAQELKNSKKQNS